MTIRKKLMFLLFSISLIPLLTIVILYQVTINYFTHRISENIQTTLEENARFNMEQMLGNYEKNLRLNVKLLGTLVKLQATEVEKTLSQPSSLNQWPSGKTFGLNDQIIHQANLSIFLKTVVVVCMPPLDNPAMARCSLSV